MPPLSIKFPLGGLNRRLDFQSQPDFTSPDLLNVLDRDPLAGRLRGGSRPGIVKALSTQLGEWTGTPGTVTLTPSKDTYISSSAATSNFDTSNLLCGYNSSAASIRRMLMHFDLSSIPAGATITDATLYLTASSSFGAFPGGWVRRLRRTDWVENQATWNIYKTANNWTTAGASSGVSDHDTTGQVSWSYTPGTTIITGLGPLTQDAYSSGVYTDALHLLLLSQDETINGAVTFADSENGTAAFRPQLVVNYVVTLGTFTGTPIRMAAICRSLEATSQRVYSDVFSGAAMSADWTAGAWGDAALPTVSGGKAILSTALGAETRAAILTAAAAISTAATRSVSINMSQFAPGISGSHTVSLLLDTRTAAPGQTEGIRADLLYSSTGAAVNTTLKLYINGVQVGSTVSYTTRVWTMPKWFKLTIDGSKIVSVYWSSASTADLTYNASSYTPAQTLAGFEFSQTATPAANMTADDFRLEYTLNVANKPANMLVVVSDGRLYYQTTLGTWVEANYTSSCTLASDRLLIAAPYLQKLYIADYGVAASGTNGTVSYAAPNGTLTDATQDFTAAGVTAADYRVEVLSTGSGTIGIYEITAVGTTTVTFTGNAGATAGVQYRIARAAKVFDGSTAIVSKVPIGTIGSGDGQFPLNCSLVAAGMNRLIWGGDSDYPHFAFASKKGDEENYLYGATPAETAAYAWDPARLAGSQAIGDAITALIPHRDDYFVFGCRNSCFILRGDPGLGGELDIITPNVGIVGPRAACQLPDGSLALMTTAGLYRVPPESEAVPIPVSPLSLPQELKAIDTEFNTAAPTSGFDVLMEYDVERSLVVIAVSPRSASSGTRHWLHRPGSVEDVEGLLQYGGSFWPLTCASTTDPTALVAYTPTGGTKTVCLLCRDGYARKFSDAAADDDGTAFSWYFMAGPIMLSGGDYLDGLLEEVVLQTAKDSATATMDILAGVSGEAAYNSAIQTLGTVAGNTKRTFPVRRRGNAVILKVSGTGIAAFESMQIKRTPLGKQRVG